VSTIFSRVLPITDDFPWRLRRIGAGGPEFSGVFTCARRSRVDRWEGLQQSQSLNPLLAITQSSTPRPFSKDLFHLTCE
jgi:hypothetical protein